MTEAALFLAIAALIHAAAFWAWPANAPRATAGEGGDANLTLTGANAATEALIETWERDPAMAPPDEIRAPRPAAAPPSPASGSEPPWKTAAGPGYMTAPERAKAPDTPASAEKPESPRAAEAPTPTRADNPDPGHGEPPPSSPSPRARPERPRKPVESSKPKPESAPPAREPQRSQESEAQPSERAAGAGGGREAGAGAAPETGGEGEASARLTERWGGAIRRDIERKKRYPRHIRRSGAALVEMTVERSGALMRARIARSSGSEGLDEAAITAVKAAAPYDPAPAALRGGSFRFVLQVNFRR